MHFSTFTTITATAMAAFSSLAFGAAIEKRATYSGEATYYGGNVQGGACSFSTYTLPSGIFGTALSDSNWSNSAECGGCVSVKGPNGNSITAMIVDECPGCGTNHLDLFPTAFSSLADPSKGVIDITWDYVPCPVTGPLEIHMKSGVSAYWFSAQVVNGHRRTHSLDVSIDQGKTWKTTTRQTYNFFEISSGAGASTAWVRATSHTGTQVIVKNVPMTGDAVVKAGSNYA